MTPKEVSEKLRAVAVKHWGMIIDDDGFCISRMATDAADAIDSLQAFVDHINLLPNCNDCGLKNCVCRPGLGETIRYNCPGYKESKKDLESVICKIGDVVKAEVLCTYNQHESIITGKVVDVSGNIFRVEYMASRYVNFLMSDIGKTVTIT